MPTDNPRVAGAARTDAHGPTRPRQKGSNDITAQTPFIEHSRRILVDYLGYDAKRIAGLERDGALHGAPD
jgi:hypothetical protein